MEAATKLSTLGKYSLIASLGQGGMAKVYLALMAGPAGFNKLLVVKALREDMHASSDEFVQMFLDEARLAARLNHPNIVQTYEVGEADGRYFIAMEYLEGQSLRTVQRKVEGGLSLEHEIYVIAETARGLHYAHELRGFDGEALGVVHRDVSPQNVFVTYDGQVKLLDFGIAKTQDAEHLTKVGVIKGKIDYIAPEQIRGEQIDRRADVFALGAMLWEGVCGQRFAGGPKVADVTKIHTRVTGGEAKLRHVKPDIDEELATIVDKAIALDPAQRYQTAEELADALHGYLERFSRKPNGRTLQEVVAPPFAEERAKMRSLIDQQIQIAQRRGGVSLGETTGGLPRIGRNTLSSRSVELELTESGYPDFNGDSLPVLETSSPSSSYSKPKGMPLPPLPTAAHVAAQPVRHGPPRGVVLALLGLAVAGGVAFALREGHDPAASHPTTALPAAVVPAVQVRPDPDPAVVTPAVETVRIHIEASPRGAQATLDGALLPKLPFTAELRKDGTIHQLEVQADGYEAQKVMVPFDRNRDVKVTLDPVAQARDTGPQKPGRRRPAPVQHVESQQQITAPTPAPQPEKPRDEPMLETPSKPGKQRTGIDISDPYAN